MLDGKKVIAVIPARGGQQASAKEEYTSIGRKTSDRLDN
uniref:Uncharacterized protein n=1 Tax=Vibrio parahaemolyticus TaxID=670 RepID=A0A7M1VVV7_VIBPH|nr:hypothetical protein VP36_00016 [Vibrio parahaemolyticus]